MVCCTDSTCSSPSRIKNIRAHELIVAVGGGFGGVHFYVVGVSVGVVDDVGDGGGVVVGGGGFVDRVFQRVCRG